WQKGPSFKKVQITWRDCPRITAEFIAEETRAMGQSWVDQEYGCLFTAREGLVYPDFASCLIDRWPEPAGSPVGGIALGWRTPLAALWGVLDRDDVLWLEGERYLRQTPLHEHAAALRQRRQVVWYADPAGATEIAELRSAGLAVRRGDNDIRLGIAAVSARLRTGRLPVLAGGCPNLLAESRLYRCAGTGGNETPVGDHNHALAALRYLIAGIDVRFLARLRRRPETCDPEQPATATEPPPAGDEALWTVVS